MIGSFVTDKEFAPALCAPATLFADRARALMLLALRDSAALAGTELARTAGISRATASRHVARLIEGGLVLVDRRGRLCFYRLANQRVARAIAALEALTEGDHGTDAPSLEPSDRLARTCYDHLAGRIGVQILDALVRQRFVSTGGGELALRLPGRVFLREFGVDLRQPSQHRRAIIRPCLDRTERRHHMAGNAGAQLARRAFDLGWFERESGSRALRITPSGRRGLKATFGLEA
jgi:DNA-binding transcriptional ArsR family regulator